MNESTEKAKEYGIKSWEAIKLAWAGGIGIVKKGWTIFALSAALMGAAGYIWWLGHKNQQAEEKILEVTTQIDDLKKQSQELIELNQKNQETYSKIAEDRARMDQLVESFNYQITANVKALNSISRKVNTLEDGELAPVLKETIRQIQSLREARDE